MLADYRESIYAYRSKKISLHQERRLISLAQKGCEKSRQEIILRHVGFVIQRLYRKVIPYLLVRHKEDMVSTGIIVLHEKIMTYNLNYQDRQGKRKPVRALYDLAEKTCSLWQGLK